MAELDNQKKRGLSAKIEKYKAILENNPDSLVFAQLAETYLEAGDVDMALKVCEEGLKKHPNFIDGHYVKGLALLQTNKEDEAASCFEFVLKLNPEHLLAQEALSKIRRFSPPKDAFDEGSEHVSIQVKPRKSMPRNYIQDPVSAVRRKSSEVDVQRPFPWVRLLIVVLVLVFAIGGWLVYRALLQARLDERIASLKSNAMNAAYSLKYDDLYGVFGQIIELSANSIDANKALEGAKYLTAGLLYGEYSKQDPDVNSEMKRFGSRMSLIDSKDSITALGAAVSAYYLGNPGAASYYISFVSKVGPAAPIRNAIEAGCHMAAGENYKSIQLLEATVKRNPDAVLPSIMLTRAYIAKRDYDSALSVMKSLYARVGQHRLVKFFLIYVKSLQNSLSSDDVQQLVAVITGEDAFAGLESVRALAIMAYASYLEERKEYADALKLMQRSYPFADYDNPRIRFLMAKAALFSRQFELAETNIRRAVKQQGLTTEYADLLIRLYYDTGRWQKVVSVFEELGQESLLAPELWEMVGDSYLNLGNFELAAHMLRRALFAFPNSIAISRKYATALIKGESYAEAEKFINQIRSQKPNSALPYILSAMLYKHKGDTKRAKQALLDALKIDPTNQEALYDLAQIYKSEGDIASYIKEVEALHKAAPNYSEGALMYADWMLEKRNKAELEALAAQFSTNDDCMSQRIRARILFMHILDADEAGKLKQAMSQIRNELRTLNITCCGIDKGIDAIDYALQNMSNSTESSIQKAVVNGGSCFEPHFLAGLAMEKYGDFDWATNEYMTALDLESALPEVYFRLGKIFYEEKMIPKAKKAFELAANWYRFIPERKRRWAEILYYKGLIHISSNEYDKGKRMLLQASKVDPSFALPYVALVHSIYKGVNNAKALALLKKALQIDPNLSQAIFERGDVYRLMGNKKKAIENFVQYLQMAPHGEFEQMCKDYLKELK